MGVSLTSLLLQATLASWDTPTALTFRKSGRAMESSESNGRRSGGGQSSGAGLEQQAELAHGIIPKELLGPSMAKTRARLGISESAYGPARVLPDGTVLTGSSAAMGDSGQLSPEHSRWLQGIPSAWDACAPTGTRSSRSSPQS
jgi:hypothetical protein